MATPEQQETLVEALKTRVENEPSLQGYEAEKAQVDRSTLLRFLKGMSWDLDKAFDNLSFSLKWRQDFQSIGVDNIQEETVLGEMRRELAFVYKQDKTGRPVIYTRAGKYNRADRNLEELWRMGVLLFETALKSAGAEEKVCVVVDETGFGMHGLDVDLLKLGAPVLDKCYPERISNLLFINAPTVFSTAWNVISPFIAEHTRTKVRFLTDTRQLFEYINEDDVPTEFGGKDPFVYDCFRHGLVGIPTGDPAERPINKLQSVQQLSVAVSAGGVHEHTFQVQFDEGQKRTLCWDFRTESKDIGFTVLFRPEEESSASVVVPNRRVESHLNKEKGRVTVDRSGRWVLQWDNTYSRWTSKVLSFEAYITDSF